MLPDFIICGGQKCGTTAAARNLALHPEVSVFRGLTKAGQKNEIEFYNQHWDKGLDWYLSHFKAGGTIQGEKTAELLHRTVCHGRMSSINPALKIIVFLRSPAERAYSQWRMAALHKGDETDDFDTVVRNELNHIDDSTYRTNFYNCIVSEKACWREGYLLKGMYAEQLKSLFMWFPRDQVHVAIAERVRLQMATSYAKIYEFLGASPFVAEYDEHFVGKAAAPMSAATKSLLKSLYRQPNEELFSMIGYEVHEWK